MKQISRSFERKRRIKSVLASVTALRMHGIPFLYTGHLLILPLIVSIRRFGKRSDMLSGITKKEITVCYAISMMKLRDSNYLIGSLRKMTYSGGILQALHASWYPAKLGKSRSQITFLFRQETQSLMTLFP